MFVSYCLFLSVVILFRAVDIVTAANDICKIRSPSRSFLQNRMIASPHSYLLFPDLVFGSGRRSDWNSEFLFFLLLHADNVRPCHLRQTEHGQQETRQAFTSSKNKMPIYHLRRNSLSSAWAGESWRVSASFYLFACHTIILSAGVNVDVTLWMIMAWRTTKEAIKIFKTIRFWLDAHTAIAIDSDQHSIEWLSINKPSKRFSSVVRRSSFVCRLCWLTPWAGNDVSNKQWATKSVTE